MSGPKAIDQNGRDIGADMVVDLDQERPLSGSQCGDKSRIKQVAFPALDIADDESVVRLGQSGIQGAVVA